MRVTNPFAKPHDPNRVAPGGIDGTRVDYVRWYPPDTPFHWGQGFNHALTNVPAINGGRWINEFLPDKNYETPFGVGLIAWMWPAAVGTDGRTQVQLGGGPNPVAGPPVAIAMDAYAKAQAKRPGSVADLAGGFARS